MGFNSDEVKKVINSHLAEVHRISDVASYVGIPVETLRKEFVRREKVNLSMYVASCRVDRMKMLLELTGEKCSAICFEVGLREDAGARLFRRMTGMTMQEFRWKAQEKMSSPPS